MVTHGSITRFADLRALADLATTKRLPGYPFKFLQEFWEVNSEEEMLKLGCADRGERPGGIAIRRDLLGALQLTGSDYRDSGAWTASQVQVLYGIVPSGGADGDFVYSIDVPSTVGPVFSAMYQRIGGAWVLLANGQWTAEMQRIRGATVLYYQQQFPANFSKLFLETEDGESYGPSGTGAPKVGGFSQNKYCVARTLISWPVAIQNSVKSFIPYDELEFIAAQSGVQVTLTGYAKVNEYAQSDADNSIIAPGRGGRNPHQRMTYKIRFELPIPMRVQMVDFAIPASPAEETIINAGIPFGFVYEPANFRVIEDSHGFVTTRTQKAGSGSFTRDLLIFSIDGQLPAGISDVSFTLGVERPYYFMNDSNISSDRRIRAQGVVSGAGVITASIHATSPVYATQVIAPSTKIRIAGKMRGKTATHSYFTFPNEPTVDWWWVDNAFTADSGGAPGFFKTKVAMVSGVSVLERDHRNPTLGKLILAPRAEDAIDNVDHTIRIGAVGDSSSPAQPADPGAIRPPFPRCYFRRDTEPAVELRSTQGGITTFDLLTAGSTIPMVTIRRIPQGEPSWQVEDQQPIDVELGCIRNGQFVRFQLVTILGQEATIYPDWVIYTAHSLAYRCAEAVDIQAAVVSPLAYDDRATANPLGLWGGPFGWRLADFYNNTLDHITNLTAVPV